MKEKQHVYPIDSLEFGYLSDDQIQALIQASLVSISTLAYNELLMPHEMANDTFELLDKDKFNDNELEYVRDNILNLICDLTNILYTKNCHVGQYRLIFINSEAFSIGYTETPKENF